MLFEVLTARSITCRAENGDSAIAILENWLADLLHALSRQVIRAVHCNTVCCRLVALWSLFMQLVPTCSKSCDANLLARLVLHVVQAITCTWAKVHSVYRQCAKMLNFPLLFHRVILSLALLQTQSVTEEIRTESMYWVENRTCKRAWAPAEVLDANAATKKTANMLLEQEAIEETPNTRQAIGSETAKLLLQQQACGKLEALQPFRVNQGRY